MEYSKVSKEIFDPVNANKKIFEEVFKDKLSEIFPSSIKDGEVDFKALLAELGEYVDSNERFELTWAGKNDAKRVANKDIVANQQIVTFAHGSCVSENEIIATSFDNYICKLIEDIK